MNNPYGEKLAQFLDDEAMYQAVRKILEAQFDLNNMTANIQSDVADERLGEMTRSCLGGAALLKQGFKELEKFRRVPAPKTSDDVNPAL